MPTFDIVSEIDRQEVDNAMNQARKELVTRFDFKGSTAAIEQPSPRQDRALRRGRHAAQVIA